MELRTSCGLCNPVCAQEKCRVNRGRTSSPQKTLGSLYAQRVLSQETKSYSSQQTNNSSSNKKYIAEAHRETYIH